MIFGKSRERRAFERTLRIAALEHSVGIESDDPDIPTIRVVRNPNGFEWMPWVALGFPGEYLIGTFDSGYNVDTYAVSKRACVRRARERLWQIHLAKTEEPVYVGIERA